MKNLSFLFLVGFAFMVISCGNKDGNTSGSSSSSSMGSFSSDPYKVSTVNCRIMLQQNGAITCGSQTFQPTQNSISILSAAINEAVNVKHWVPVNNSYWQVKITGQASVQANQVSVQSAVIYK